MKTNHYDENQEFQSGVEDYSSVPKPITTVVQDHVENGCIISVQRSCPEATHDRQIGKAYSLDDLRQDHFLFKNPSKLQFEMTIFIEGEFEPRVKKKGLLQWSEIDTTMPDYAAECARKIIKEEIEKGIFYSKAEVKKKAHQWLNKRIRTWLHKKKQEDRGLYELSLLYLIERDDEGEIIGIALGNLNEIDLSANSTNSYYHIPIDVMLSKQNIPLPELIEQTLNTMAKLKTKNSSKHLAILAPLFNSPELINETELEGLSKISLNNLYFHARKRFITIIEGLCPDIRQMLKLYPVKAKISKCEVKKVKESYRNPLFNDDHKHGDIIIYQRTDGPSESASNIERGDSHYKPTKIINFNKLLNARKLYGKKDGTRLLLEDNKSNDEKFRITPTLSLCTQSVIDRIGQTKPFDKDPEYDDAA